jgi:hypothetical protein
MPKMNPNSMVWTSAGIANGTEWPTRFAFLIGLISVILTMGGYNAPFHLSKECNNANIAFTIPIALSLLAPRVYPLNA